jgi:FtsP/CotA-like multicopper oxidase with cupredoxin domain
VDENARPPGEPKVIHTPIVEGTTPGPTLSVEPGDKLSILLFNDLPPNPPNERDHFFPHEENTINLHSHGLTVSPLGISDNIFRQMEPGKVHKVEVKIPKDHPSDTLWYHTHKHVSVSYQSLGGMAGFLIVRGGPGTPRRSAGGCGCQRHCNGISGHLDDRRRQSGFSSRASTSVWRLPVPNPPPPPEVQELWSAYGN